MQRLITLFVESTSYSHKHEDYYTRNGEIKDHLTNELKQGWKIVSVNALGGSTIREKDVFPTTQGYFAVVLVK